MKIQNLAIIFIILILPISLVLASYTKTRVETLNLQSEYDTKLNSATYDALKAYQVNSFQNKTNGFVNSKIRDINASINTFFNSMSTSFSTLGYTKESIQNYIPAIVYTMYDGYYVYAPFTNTWGTNSTNEDIQKEMTEQIGEQTKYKNGENQYGLKPYVYYSCRYKKGNNIDVVITYSLDSYIQIQGIINGKTVSKYGYILNETLNVKENGEIEYEGVPIVTETGLMENVYVKKENDGDDGDDGEVSEYHCLKKGGTKYYSNGSNSFTVSNGQAIKQDEVLNNSEANRTTANDITQNNNAKKYYKEAKELSKFIDQSGLGELTTNDIVDIDTGIRYGDENDKDNPYTKGRKIFDFDCREEGGIESEKSNFNLHRIDVIKNSIERNLSIIIANYDYGKTEEFRLPKLKDSDWDKITDNIGIITFLQGVNIGGKVYNGYSIVSNTKNEDVVTYDSIYIKDSSDIFHNITENFEGTSTNLTDAIGIFNVNIERRSMDDANAQSGYFFPVYGTLSYDSIITKNNIAKKSNQTMKEYLNSLNYDLKKIYYTALARERYGIYRPKLEI